MLALTNRQKINMDITVVIRSVGERTEGLCFNLLTKQIASQNIHITHETPFSVALRKAFQIGIKEDKNWTLMVDADVLIRQDLLQDLYHKARREIACVFALQTEMLDKFFGGQRVGGIKLLRTSLMRDAIKLIPHTDNRPETNVIKQMHKMGYYVDITNIICGIHDFEQYYSDIFRKGFTHAIKHDEFSKILMPYWKRMSIVDSDFKILIKGNEVGKTWKDKLVLHKDEVKSQFSKIQREMKIEEKSKLGVDKYCDDFVDSLIKTYCYPKEYPLVKNALDKKGRPTFSEQCRS